MKKKTKKLELGSQTKLSITTPIDSQVTGEVAGGKKKKTKTNNVGEKMEF